MRHKLTDAQKSVCEMAVKHYGLRAQAFKVAEELRELANEVEIAAGGGASAAALVDERADVAVILYQLDELLLPNTLSTYAVSERIAYKIERLERRIADERGQ